MALVTKVRKRGRGKSHNGKSLRGTGAGAWQAASAKDDEREEEETQDHKVNEDTHIKEAQHEKQRGKESCL